MSQSTPNLALPLLQASQAQKHLTHNEALLTLDCLVQIGVASRAHVSPPASPAVGERHLVSGVGDGAWAGHGGELAVWDDGLWRFHVPSSGWIVWIDDEHCAVVHDGGDWIALPGPLDKLGINATADTTNRLVVASAASLFDGTDAGGDHRLKVNKTAEGDTATVLFQTAYSGRAELGLAGGDDFDLKVSADGAAWTQALSVDRASGRVGFGKAPGTVQCEVGGGIRSVSASAAFLQLVNTGESGSQVWIGVPDWNRSAFYIYGTQTDIMSIYDGASRSQRLYAGGAERLRIASGGDIGIGIAIPTAKLHVNGPVRTAAYAKAALPAAATVGAGTLAYVTDATGGAQFAYSNGSAWLKVRDGAAV